MPEISGSHRLPDGTCCHCGPANLVRGPKWDCEHAPTPKEAR